MPSFIRSLQQRIQRIRRDIQNRKPDRDIAPLDADIEYGESQRNEALNPETPDLINGVTPDIWTALNGFPDAPKES